MIPYDPTSIFNALGELFGFLEKISPAITQCIEAYIPLEKQRIMDRRIRRCKRTCRKGNLGSKQIAALITLDFDDLNPDLRADIFDLLVNELQKKL